MMAIHNVTRASKPDENHPDALSSCFCETCVYTVADCNHGGTRTRNPQIRSLMRYPLRHAVNCVHPVGFEPWAFRMQSGRSATELHPLYEYRTPRRYLVRLERRRRDEEHDHKNRDGHALELVREDGCR